MKRSFNLLLTVVIFASACSKKGGSGTTSVGPIVNTPMVTTFAGNGSAAAVDGTKAQASFNGPTGLSISSDGFLFVADKQNNIIRIISPQGVVNTIAGNTKIGFSNTKGAVTFNFPSGVGVDATGNVYVADDDNSAIRRIDPTGAVITFAGNGGQGSGNGLGTAAQFSGPTGVATDVVGNVYVADNGNNLIRKITPKGQVTTFAGSGSRGNANGQGTAASFNQPQALTVDAGGNVYVADEGNNMIRKIAPDGTVTTLAGGGGSGAANGKGSAATFSSPAGVAVDSDGNVYVGDSGNNLIRKIAPDGTVTTLAGTGAAGSVNRTLMQSSFNSPQGVAVDQYGDVFVADTGNNLIRRVSQ